jgi:hypothetical protein
MTVNNLLDAIMRYIKITIIFPEGLRKSQSTSSKRSGHRSEKHTQDLPIQGMGCNYCISFRRTVRLYQITKQKVSCT